MTLTTRLALDLSQEDMARLLGVSFASVNRWEAGKSGPKGVTLDLLAALRKIPRRRAARLARQAREVGRGVWLHRVFAAAYGSKEGGGENG